MQLPHLLPSPFQQCVPPALNVVPGARKRAQFLQRRAMETPSPEFLRRERRRKHHLQGGRESIPTDFGRRVEVPKASSGESTQKERTLTEYWLPSVHSGPRSEPAVQVTCAGTPGKTPIQLACHLSDHCKGLPLHCHWTCPSNAPRPVLSVRTAPPASHRLAASATAFIRSVARTKLRVADGQHKTAAVDSVNTRRSKGERKKLYTPVGRCHKPLP